MKRGAVTVLMMLLCTVACAQSQVRYLGIFDRYFIQKLQRPWSKTALDNLLKCHGLQIRPHHWHWDGLNNTYLNVDTAGDRITHMTVLTPDGDLLDLH